MPKLVIHQEKVEDPQVLVDICPFGAMEEKDGKLSINAACKMCKLCVKKGPAGAVEYVEDEKKEEIDKSQWNGIAVYVDHVDGEIHPVTYELIGKARELASKINHPVYALFMGNNISDKAEELLHYGVDKVFVYDFPELARFKIESYTSVFEDFIKKRHADRGQIACGVALEAVSLEFGNRQRAEYFFRGGKLGQQVFEIIGIRTVIIMLIVGLNTQG